jgi:hypothetical protein
MEDFNRLLHDQQVVLMRAQFAELGQRRVALRGDVCAIAERINAHPYPYRSGRAVRAVLATIRSTASGVAA